MTGVVKTPTVQALIDAAHIVQKAAQFERDWVNHGVEQTFFREMAEHYAPRGHSLTFRQRQLLPQLWAYDCGDQNRIALRLTHWGGVRGVVLSPRNQYPIMDFRRRADDIRANVLVRLMGITPMNCAGQSSLEIWDGAFGVWFNDPAFIATRELAAEVRESFEYREAMMHFQKETKALPQVKRAAEIVAGIEDDLLVGKQRGRWLGILLSGGFVVHRSDVRSEGSGCWIIGVPRGIGGSPAPGLHAPRHGNFDYSFHVGRYSYEITEAGLSTESGTLIADSEGHLLK